MTFVLLAVDGGVSDVVGGAVGEAVGEAFGRYAALLNVGDGGFDD